MTTTLHNPTAMRGIRLIPRRRRPESAAASLGLAAVHEGMLDTVVAAEVAAAHAHSVSDAAERVTGQVTEVSNLVGQLEDSVAEISRSTHASAAVVTSIAAASGDAVDLLHRLGDATSEIVAMVDFIKAIAEQTDLLALNATIEAARAGESGRGFGVVATEVKELAHATADATGKIAAIVERLRSQSAAALGGANQIATLVDEFSSQHSVIAAAVEEQAIATGDITRTLHDATSDISTVADGILSVATQTYQATMAASVTKQAIGDLTNSLGAQMTAAPSDDPLLSALAAHSDWKARLVRAVATSSTDLQVAEVRAPDRCAFGAWLHGTIEPGDRAAKQYEPVAALHARFHQLAADVLQLAQTSQRDLALAAIGPGSEYAGVSADLADHIVEWRRCRSGTG